MFFNLIKNILKDKSYVIPGQSLLHYRLYGPILHSDFLLYIFDYVYLSSFRLSIIR